MSKPVLIGAVIYDPRVSVIWDIIREFFSEQNCPIDVVYYTNYELLVQALKADHIDMAWNSPLAWLDSLRVTGGKCRAIAMRDTDQDRRTYFLVRKDSGITSLADLKGKTIALGAQDSPQAALIPLGHLVKSGLLPEKDFKFKRFDLLVGKHGDHIGGELEAFHSLKNNEVEVCAMLDMNWDTWTADGTISSEEYEILDRTAYFDHCVFTVKEDFPMDIEKKWLEVLFSMSYENPDHREMMDLEGLKEWKTGRVSGFGPLSHAVESVGFFEGKFK
jgi:phosphonate transport system substrate-binding protein